MEDPLDWSFNATTATGNTPIIKTSFLFLPFVGSLSPTEVPSIISYLKYTDNINLLLTPFFSYVPTGATHAPSAATSNLFDDPFSEFMTTSTTSTSAPITAHASTPAMPIEDPLDMFGGTPIAQPSGIPSQAPVQAVHSSTFDDQDDFLAGFSQPPPPPSAVHQSQHAQQDPWGRQTTSNAAATSVGTATFVPAVEHLTEVSLNEESEKISHHPDRDSSHASVPPLSQRTSRTLSSNSSSFVDRISEPMSPPTSSHKAFAFLDAKAATQQAQQAASGGSAQQQAPIPPRQSGVIPLDAPTPLGGRTSGRLGTSGSAPSLEDQHFVEQHSHSTATEGIVELGHRTAKALQASTKWFMRASKQIATEVHQKIEKHRQHAGQHGQHGGGHFGDSSFEDEGMSGTSGMRTNTVNNNNASAQSFYYEWASQLVKMSPETRAAALGAMQEDDRLEVQRIMDEAELGETILEKVSSSRVVESSSHFDHNADMSDSVLHRDLDLPVNEHKQGVSQASQPAPPSYEEVMSTMKSGSSSQPSRTPNPTTATATKRSTVAAAPPPAHAADLLNLDEDSHNHTSNATINPTSGTTTAVDSHSQQQQPFSVAPMVDEMDFLGMEGSHTKPQTNTTNRPSPSPSPAAAAAASTSHIDDLFTVPRPGARPVPAGGRSTGAVLNPSAGSGGAKRPPSHAGSSSTAAPGGGISSMIDLGEALSAVDITGHDALYADAGGADGGDAEEPEIRRILRQKRIAEKHERMKLMLAEKRAREEAEDAEKAGKVAFRDTLKPKIDAWAAGKKDNIRALLSTLHVVIWEGSGWTSPSIADMVDPGKVKKWYMKANLVVHPDKVKQKGGTLEQVATADMIFDVLKGAWGKFEASR